jgi:acyl carrier protein
MSMNPFFQIKRYLKRSFYINVATIQPNRQFDQLGLNGMEINEMILELEIINRVQIPDNSLSNIRTIGDLADLVNYHRGIL